MYKLKIAAALAVCGLASSCSHQENDAAGYSAQTAAAQAMSAASTALAAAARPFPKWDYGMFLDTMAGKPVYTASLSSEETVDLAAPYSGKQSATLVLRVHPDGGADVLFIINRGQIVCNDNSDSNGCPMDIRLGVDPQHTAYGNIPADHSPNAMFLHGDGLTLSSIAAAGTLRVQVPIYANGSIVFTFDTASLDLSKLKVAGT